MTLKTLTKHAVRFRDARDWKKFHKPKDLAMNLSIEAAELLEQYLWKKDGEREDLKEIGDELSDVLLSVLLLAHHYGLDLEKAFIHKLKKNAKKYPVRKSRGRNLKYDRL